MAHGADMLAANSFYSNGGHEPTCSSAKALHLDSDLVPFAPAPAAASPARQPASPSKSPAAHRISTIDWTRLGFEDGAAGGTGASPSRTPQRVCVDGAWRLKSSLSSPSLPVTYSPCPGASKHVVRQPERKVQLDNYAVRAHDAPNPQTGPRAAQCVANAQSLRGLAALTLACMHIPTLADPSLPHVLVCTCARSWRRRAVRGNAPTSARRLRRSGAPLRRGTHAGASHTRATHSTHPRAAST